jgi:hypothetical protein
MIGTITSLALAFTLTAGDKVEHDPRDDGPDKIDVSGYPKEQAARYPIFVQKCSKCHPVARPINSRFDASEWKRYMKKMIRRPNSGINEEQAADVYEFLKYYASKQSGGK